MIVSLPLGVRVTVLALIVAIRHEPLRFPLGSRTSMELRYEPD